MADLSYTTEDQVEVRASVVGVDLRTDDDTAPTINPMTDCISRASATIDFYCSAKYSTTGLAASRFITKLATDLALWELCKRRLNPAPNSVAADAEAAIALLEKISTGEALIPGVARSIGMAPTVVNHRIDLRGYPGSRTDLNRSSELARQNTGFQRNIDRTERSPS